MSGSWNTETIAGKSADVYQPAGRPRFGVLHLHGYQRETLRERPAFMRLFDELQLACVCPHGQRSWWVDRVCAEFDPALSSERYLRQHVLPFFRERWNLAPRAVGLQGIS